MLFNTDAFLFGFLPLTYLAYLIATRLSPAATRLVLCLASCAFYAAWKLSFLPLLLLSAGMNYTIGLLLGRAGRRGRRLLLGAGVAANLLLLSYFKYAGFFAGMVGATGWQGVVLPIGISFYTFTQIAYLCDVVEEPARLVQDPVRYLLFVTFFPHLVAGPVLHHRDMIPQFGFATRGRNCENFVVGAAIFTLGLAKKTLLADNIQPFVALAFGPHAPGPEAAWAGALAYMLQIYFDFSGYSDMAIGLARLFGVVFPLNFNSPYKAASIIDFWRRWHMTLSRFLRDYLYIPLGGNRTGLGWMPNLMITMVLGGLWHGAGWTYIAWGALHGGFLVVNHGWRRLNLALPAWCARALTLACVAAAWVFFRAGDFAQAIGILRAMAGIDRAGAALTCADPLAAGAQACLLGAPTVAWWLAGGFLLALFAPNTQQILAPFHPTLDPVAPPGWPVAPRGWLDRALAFQPTLVWAAALGILFAAATVWQNSDSPFLYYQF